MHCGLAGGMLMFVRSARGVVVVKQYPPEERSAA